MRRLALLTGLLAVALAALLPSAASAGTPVERADAKTAKKKKGKRKKCRRGTTRARMGKKRVCVKKKSLRKLRVRGSLSRARKKAISALTSPARVRKATGKRWRRYAVKASRKGRRLLRKGAARLARPAGIAQTVSGGSIETPPGHVGSGREATAEGGRAGVGSAAMTMGGYGFVTKCPGPGGVLTGTAGDKMNVKQSINIPEGRGRRRLVLTLNSAINGKLRGRVGDDAQLIDYNFKGKVKLLTHVQVLGPAGLEHLGTQAPSASEFEVVLEGLKPGRPISPSAIKIDPVSVGASDVEVRNGVASVKKEALQSLGVLIWGMKSQADDAFREAEKNYNEEAACLKAAFDPAQRSMRPRQPEPTRVTVSDMEGRRVGIELDSEGRPGTATPGRARTSESGPATFTLTPNGEEDYMWFGVTGTSNRGRVTGSVSYPVTLDDVFAYRVAITGTGIYAADYGNNPSIHHHARSTFSFTTTWPTVIIPADGRPPGSPNEFQTSDHVLTGDHHNYGEYTGDPPASYDCEGELSAGGGGANERVRVGTGAGGRAVLRINPFWSAAGDGACTKEGTFFSSPQPSAWGGGANGIADWSVGAPVSLSRAQLDRSSFTVPVSARPLPANCEGYPSGSSYCTQSGNWSGTATFTRVYACRRYGQGYVCGFPVGRAR